MVLFDVQSEVGDPLGVGVVEHLRPGTGRPLTCRDDVATAGGDDVADGQRFGHADRVG